MRQLQLSPPLLIITMGLPGSGKSFFARQFADLYSLPRISEDRLRYELFEKPLFNTDESEIINRVGSYMLEQTMKTGRPVVYEGAFLSAAERKAAVELARANGYRTLVVWLQTDLETSAQRAATRDRRNPDSKYAFAINKMTFEAIKNKLQKPHEREVLVVVSGKHAFKSQCLTVLRKIAAVYSDSASKGDFGVGSSTETTSPAAAARPNQRFVQ